MRGTAMINIQDYKILDSNRSTLKKTSKDTANNIVMTDCEYEVINFDKVVKEYASQRHMKECPESIDALLINSTETATMIEFKNKYINKGEQFKLAKKIYDSIFVLSDILNQGIGYTRKHLDYILVYSMSKNNSSDDEKTQYRESKSRNIIANTISNYAKTKHIRFALDVFEQYCFRSVYTYTEEEFKIKVTDNL